MNVTRIDIDGRPALRFERTYAFPIERVWRAVSEPAELEQWFIAAADWKPEEGERFEVYGTQGVVKRVEPPNVLAWDFGAESFAFALSPEGEGCRLVFDHVFDPEAGSAAGHAPGWEVTFVRLEPWLEGGEMSWRDAQESLSELNERYAVEFGESAANGRQAHAHHAELRFELDGGILSFERHFGYPIDRVWRAIAEEREDWFPSGAEVEITASEAPRLLEASFFGDRLRFELTEEAGGCRLRFTHAISDPSDSALAAAGWDRCILRLDALLAGAPIGESESLELWPVLHARYAELFGVDPAKGERAFAEHPAG